MPYGTFLQSWLGGRGRVTVSGVCGELTQEMVARFPSDVVGHQPEAVVILGGTNDLGSGLMPDVIMKNLENGCIGKEKLPESRWWELPSHLCM